MYKLIRGCSKESFLLYILTLTAEEGATIPITILEARPLVDAHLKAWLLYVVRLKSLNKRMPSV